MKGWTQSALAGRAGVSKRTIETAEAGGRVNATSLNAIAGALEVPAGELVATRRLSAPVTVNAFRGVGEALRFAVALAEQWTPESVRQAMALVEPWTRWDERQAQAKAWTLYADLWLRQAMVEPGVKAGSSRSLECARRAVELAPQDAGAHAQLAVSLAARNLDGGATEAMARALSLDAGMARRTPTIARGLMMLGRFTEAEACLREALAEGMGEGQSHRAMLMQVLYLARDYEGALQQAALAQLLEPVAWLPEFFTALARYSLHGELPNRPIPPAAGDLGRLFQHAASGEHEAASELLDELEHRRHPWFPLARRMPFLSPRPVVTEHCCEVRCGVTFGR